MDYDENVCAMVTHAGAPRVPPRTYTACENLDRTLGPEDDDEAVFAPQCPSATATANATPHPSVAALAPTLPGAIPWRDLAYTDPWAAALAARGATDAEAAAVFAYRCRELEAQLQRALEVTAAPIVISAPADEDASGDAIGHALAQAAQVLDDVATRANALADKLSG